MSTAHPPGPVLRLDPTAGRGATMPLFVLHPGSYELGKADDNDLVLAAHGIAGRHCRVEIGAAGVEVRRLEPGAELAVNGRAVPAQGGVRLRSADRLLIGPLEFAVRVEAAVAASTSHPPPPPAPPRPPSPSHAPARTLASAAPPLPEGLQTGALFAGYRLGVPLGSGGTSVVFRAVRVSDNLEVALKVLHPGVQLVAHAAARLFREAEVCGALASHPGVVPILEVGKSRAHTYLALRFVDGADVQTLLRRQGRLPVKTSLEIAVQAARCLAFARGLRIIHRDVKPGNLLVGRDGAVRVLDFGLARHTGGEAASAITGCGQGIGTLTYMAPEQVLNAKGVDHRADIYSLGATLYAMVAGRPPFEPTTPLQFTEKLFYVIPPTLKSLDPTVPDLLSAAIERCLEKDAARRFPEYEDLLQDLNRVLEYF
ncbi:MAG: protein kinase [Planctomycetes bacterium]|nr:protein kinase [Planctomycetota bacterium]